MDMLYPLSLFYFVDRLRHPSLETIQMLFALRRYQMIFAGTSGMLVLPDAGLGLSERYE